MRIQKKTDLFIFYDKSVKFEDKIPVAGFGESKIISYDFEFPLEAELKYFIKHLDGSDIKIANGQSAVEVMDILERSNVILEKEVLMKDSYFVHESSYVDDNVKIGENKNLAFFSYTERINYWE